MNIGYLLLIIIILIFCLLFYCADCKYKLKKQKPILHEGIAITNMSKKPIYIGDETVTKERGYELLPTYTFRIDAKKITIVR